MAARLENLSYFILPRNPDYSGGYTLSKFTGCIKKANVIPTVFTRNLHRGS
jgi:hypothetical protein